MTYVPRRLDQQLQSHLGSGSCCVILCGNPGDGKTARMQRLAKTLGCPVPTTGRPNSFKAQLPDGRRLHCLFDGSAAEEKRSADDRLEEFADPFAAGVPEGQVSILAVNDGKLLEWLEGDDDGRFS